MFIGRNGSRYGKDGEVDKQVTPHGAYLYLRQTWMAEIFRPAPVGVLQ